MEKDWEMMYWEGVWVSLFWQMQGVMKSEQVAVRVWIWKRGQRWGRGWTWGSELQAMRDQWYGVGRKPRQNRAVEMTADFWFMPGQLWEGRDHDRDYMTWYKGG